MAHYFTDSTGVVIKFDRDKAVIHGDHFSMEVPCQALLNFAQVYRTAKFEPKPRKKTNNKPGLRRFRWSAHAGSDERLLELVDSTLPNPGPDWDDIAFDIQSEFGEPGTPSASACEKRYADLKTGRVRAGEPKTLRSKDAKR